MVDADGDIGGAGVEAHLDFALDGGRRVALVPESVEEGLLEPVPTLQDESLPHLELDLAEELFAVLLGEAIQPLDVDRADEGRVALLHGGEDIDLVLPVGLHSRAGNPRLVEALRPVELLDASEVRLPRVLVEVLPSRERDPAVLGGEDPLLDVPPP